MPTLKDLLAYPARVEDVTAKSLLRYLLVQTRVLEAQVADAAANPHNVELRHRAGEYGMAFAAAHLLRTLMADDPNNRSDDAAKALWECWEDGASVGEWLWEWLTAEGIAPEQIQLAYEATKLTATTTPEVRPT